MSDAYNFIFSDDPKTGALSFEQLQARRKIAAAIATRNRGFPKTIGEGLTYFGESLGDIASDRRMAAQEAAYRRQSEDTVRRLSQPPDVPPAAPPTVAPGAGAGPGPMSSDIDPFGGGFAAAPAPAGDTETALAPVAAPEVAPAASVRPAVPVQKLASVQAFAAAPQNNSMSVEELKQRLARNETGGQRDPYRTIGPANRRGDYPYGKYQVMGENIPAWTKAYVGREMTPEEFLNDPNAQETVATGQGGKYLAKYGPVGASEAWFAGEKGRVEGRSTRKDTLGTHIDEYVRRFNKPLVSRDQVVASAVNAPPSLAPADAFAAATEEAASPIKLASLGGGMPTPDTAPQGQLVGAPPRIGAEVDLGPISPVPNRVPREAIVQSLAAQQSPMVPQPAPQPAPVPSVLPVPPQRFAQAPPPVGTPVPSTVTPPPSGPPPMPQQQPMSQREMEIRRAIGSTTDPNLRGQLEPLAERMAEERKFKDTQNMELWKKDVIAYEKRTDPMQQAQLEKAQREAADAARERLKTEARGGVSQAVIDEGIKESAKKTAPLREGSVALNEVENLLKAGMFTGTLGKVDLAIAKSKMALGGAVDPRVANSEQFSAAIAPIVAAARTSLAGSANISDADMRAAIAASGGDITLTKEGIAGIMKTVRQLQMNMARHHHELLSTAAGGDPGAERTLYGVHGLPMENIIPKNHPTVERLMQNADNEHERGLFNKAWHTPGLAEKIIIRNRAR